MRVYIDFDGVIADLHTEWFRRFEIQYGIQLDPSKAKNWDMSDLVPEGYEERFFRILDHHDLYDDVDPMPGALNALDVLDQLGIEWVVATSCTSTAMITGKVRWMHRYGIARGDGEIPDNLIIARDKSLLGKAGDVILDDALHNLGFFPGRRILFDALYNRCDDYYKRANGWTEALRLIVLP